VILVAERRKSSTTPEKAGSLRVQLYMTLSSASGQRRRGRPSREKKREDKRPLEFAARSGLAAPTQVKHNTNMPVQTEKYGHLLFDAGRADAAQRAARLQQESRAAVHRTAGRPLRRRRSTRTRIRATGRYTVAHVQRRTARGGARRAQPAPSLRRGVGAPPLQRKGMGGREKVCRCAPAHSTGEP